MVRTLKPWERDCPDCGTSFTSVQELGVCPNCSLRFAVSREGSLLDAGSRPEDRIPPPTQPRRDLFNDAEYVGLIPNFDIPANGPILAGVMGNAKNQLTVAYDDATPEQRSHASWNLGTHPDLVDRLWHEVAIDLPTRVRWVIWGVVVLLHPKSGVIFGFAGGTHNYALRVPDTVRDLALADGGGPADGDAGKMGLSILGPNWILPKFNPRDRDWAIEAFRYAESLPPIT